VQYGGLARRLPLGPVAQVSVMQFAQGRPMWVRTGEFGWADCREVVCRARSPFGEDRYNSAVTALRPTAILLAGFRRRRDGNSILATG
jgi:hypothetical protein